MKKTLVLLLFPLFIFAQKSEKIKLNYPSKDFTGTTRSLTVIDHRKDKKINDIFFKGNTYSFSFPTDDLSHDIENWFSENNKRRDKATNDMTLLIEDLDISHEYKNNEIFYFLDMKFSTFLSKEDGYYFLKRYDNVITMSSKEGGNIPNIFSDNTQKVLQKLLADSHKAIPENKRLAFENIYDYNDIFKSDFPAYSNTVLKEGVYLDYKSFFTQTPIENYKIVKNKNEVVRAVNDADDKIPSRKIYIYVENGIAYKNSQSGFLDLQQDENGFFVKANKFMLFPEEINVSSYYFLFGAIGGIGASIEFYHKYNNALEGDKYKIYIDFLNGQYSFVK